MWTPTNWVDGLYIGRLVVFQINWWNGWLLYCLALWLTGWLKAGSLSSWLIGCGMQQVVQNLNGFCGCVCTCTRMFVCMCARFFPWLKLLSLSAGPQISSLIWHVSHSQFPPLMHDSSALCSIGDCRGKSTTTACLSDCLSLSTLLELFFFADESHPLNLSICILLSCLSIWLHVSLLLYFSHSEIRGGITECTTGIAVSYHISTLFMVLTMLPLINNPTSFTWTC